ncbi:uncharacterized protein LOC112043228 [Bicyclus anynana]|uniref:Uncharacterized protein LOC112043228 n=1 Tax=Bicyclus anynana TaxID=110368 RepID=A0A6J1MNC2_BICAN|nr:uncharacterized protein LOC112043228 [Bicyclus anynana]
MVAVTQLVILATCLVTSTMEQKSMRPRLDLTPNRVGGTTPCKTKNNQTGICVHESACNEDHTILPGGVLDDIDFRDKKPCPTQGDWCCTVTDVIPHPQIGATQSEKCLALTDDVCPWCVLLYSVVDVKPTAIRPFCVGALIGSRVILTTSTCLKAAQKKMLYAQIPFSATPEKNYTIVRRQFHPDYNTGTHAYDFGIVVMESDVTFDKGKARGACIDFQGPFEGDCVGYGFDYYGTIISTFMTVKKNSCANNGNVADAACGVSTDGVCIVASGGPVLCQKNNKGGLYLMGLSRSMCDRNDQVTLGGVSLSQKWIEDELALMNISKDVFT